VEESELLSSKPLIHLESIEDYIGKCNPQNIKSCDYGYVLVIPNYCIYHLAD
jgi:hypothetical protein